MKTSMTLFVSCFRAWIRGLMSVMKLGFGWKLYIVLQIVLLIVCIPINIVFFLGFVPACCAIAKARGKNSKFEMVADAFRLLYN